jgi:hypothetical protein
MKKAAVLMLLLPAALNARTITLTAEDCDQMAVLSSKAPRLSWAAVLGAESVYNTETQLHLFPEKALLMRFDLRKIPPDQRITKAELTLPVDYLGGGNANITVRRLLADWGTGVCHTYRRTYPERIEWNQAGGRGAATDRSNKDSAVFRVEKVGEYTVDLTEDMELWYTNAAPNRGWILIIENSSGVIYTSSPYSPHDHGGKRWKLQITFEPK